MRLAGNPPSASHYRGEQSENPRVLQFEETVTVTARTPLTA